MRLLFDIETDGLKPTKIWCISIINIDTEELSFYGPDELERAKAHLERGTVLIGHNIIEYDLPVLNLLLGFQYSGKIVDTLILSRLFKNTLPSHSLEFWGKVFKQHKQDHEDWSQYSEDMKQRCISDTKLNLKLYKFFINKKDRISKSASQLEHYVTKGVKQMTEYGFLLDTKLAEKTLNKMKVEHKELQFQLENMFFPLPKKDCSYVEVPTEEGDRQIKWTKSGDVSRAITRSFDKNTVWGEFTKIIWREQNFNSNQFIIDHLKRRGWKPTEFTDNGNPKLGEEQLERLSESGIVEATVVARWDTLDRRITQVQSWLDAADKNNRVHAKVRSPGTWTFRMTHSDPNMSAVPGRGKPFAHECRSMWTVPEGKKLLGVDASGIQLRVLAEGMQDPEYCSILLDGDIHTTHQEAAELDTRDQAKTFIYAFLLGAGDAKLGQIAGEPPKSQKNRGKKLRKNFLTRIPALDTLIHKLKEQVTKRKYIIGLDGRRVYVPDPHYALAGLLQANESIIMKQAYKFWSESATHLDWNMVQWSHDEWQTEVIDDHVEELASLQVNSFSKVNKHFNMMMQLDGEYKIGTNWSETH